MLLRWFKLNLYRERDIKHVIFQTEAYFYEYIVGYFLEYDSNGMEISTLATAISKKSIDFKNEVWPKTKFWDKRHFYLLLHFFSTVKKEIFREKKGSRIFLFLNYDSIFNPGRGKSFSDSSHVKSEILCFQNIVCLKCIFWILNVVTEITNDAMQDS